MTKTPVKLTPRKTPRQARARVTQEALHVAAIQVLTREGLLDCTTTRIAERAGTSVGTLYQYYPNRDALLAAVLEAHLGQLADMVEDMCQQQCGKTLPIMAESLVKAFIEAKLSTPDASKALYAIAGERGGAEMVLRGNMRMLAAITCMIDTASDARCVDSAVTAAVALSAIVGGVRSVLEGFAPPGFEPKLEEKLIFLITAYFEAEALRQVN